MTQSSDRQRAPWFRIGPDLNMRVSDAERAEVADRLARHFGDGRLDQAEFDERVSRVMAAKTVADFQGLFDDLPDLPGDSPNGFPGGTAKAPGTPPPAAGYAARRRRGPLRGPVRALLTFVLVLVAANIVWHAVFGWAAPLVVLAAIVVAIMLVSRRGRRSCDH
jgi:hypothetical protein